VSHVIFPLIGVFFPPIQLQLIFHSAVKYPVSSKRSWKINPVSLLVWSHQSDFPEFNYSPQPGDI